MDMDNLDGLMDLSIEGTITMELEMEKDSTSMEKIVVFRREYGKMESYRAEDNM